MWLGLALVVWLWGLALYLVAYYFAVWIWSSNELHQFLGQDFYNRHIPLGGWTAAYLPTIVFLVVLALVGWSRGWLGSMADVLARRAGVPRRAVLVASHLVLVALAVPAVKLGVVAADDGISEALQRARRAEGEMLLAELRAQDLAHDAFATGQGMGMLVTAYSSGGGFGGELLLLDFEGMYRRMAAGCVASSRTEGRYERQGDLLVLHAPAGALPPDPLPREYPIRLRDIRWGGRRYLLSDEQLPEFCQAINEGTETPSEASGYFLLRTEDADLRATGLPQLPEPWGGCLLPVPLEGRTIMPVEVDGTGVDLGIEDGLRAGMRLFIAKVPLRPEFWNRWGGRQEVGHAFDVLEVEARRSRLRYVQRVQGETMMLPIPSGSLVTSLRPQDV
jgi:hypothetical protein